MGMYFGAEAMTGEDRAYQGSRFAEVRDAIHANPYQAVWGRQGEPPLPVYAVTLGSVLRGALPFAGSYLFRDATARTVDSLADLRWGPDRKGFRRLLHPNGVCLTGMWEITEETGYSGYFQNGSRALLVARYSTCCTETRRGHARSLALVGKLFPTAVDHVEPLRTASFFTQQDIGGDYIDYINDVQTFNAPDTRAWRRGIHVPVLVVTGVVFGHVDRQPSIRQLYAIAELAKPTGEPTRAPQFMRLKMAPGHRRIEGESLDIRDEVMGQIFDPGNPTPQRQLTFDIELTDQGTTRGLPVYERRTFTGWRRVGRIVFDNAVVSYNGDFVLHFHHPTWRDDPNDPSTATRVDGRKVR